MKSAEIRRQFLEFFAGHGHEIVSSSPLVPNNDPTLLFTNAGMVQFKDVFLGKDKRGYDRATSSQRCVRAGGKHNDLENVGYTARHHTFFEMLGNFSFGDYFKDDAIRYGWDFVTKTLGLPEDRLWVTVFKDDDEAAKIWLEDVGVSPERFVRMDETSNFWAMGDTGPCGPCTEIFYDHGPEVEGGPPGSPDEDGDRYVEIWNLVFMQYERDEAGKLHPLPKPSVDTGMGLERMAAVMQGVHSNYDIDLFQTLVRAAAEVTGTRDLHNASLNVIADHIRACAFLIVDGVLPSNEGRGYVLRRIIRRAIRHGFKLGQTRPFFHRLVAPLVMEMGEAYPELTKAQAQVERALLQEEQRFAETLGHGMGLLEEAIAGLDGTVIPGETAFKLYDTYGFPVDVTADIARERGLTVDMEGFERSMDAQRERARAASHFQDDYGGIKGFEGESEFTGYGATEGLGRVTALFRDGEPVETLATGEAGTVILDATPFYAESGGQVGDTGKLAAVGIEFDVADTQKVGKAHGHQGTVRQGTLKIGDELACHVDAGRRQAVIWNHTATHLMHAALREVLGDHVQQKGSLVAPDRLRFDFSHFEPVTAGEIARIERLVNEQIRRNVSAETREMEFDDAVAEGALAFFGDKYDEKVRVLRLGDFSMELCGGTHVERVGDIGLFKITSEGGIAAGVRRIEAVTGQGALDYVAATQAALARVAGLVKASPDEAEEKVRQLVERGRTMEKELKQLKQQAAGRQGDALVDQATDVGGIKVVAARMDGADAKAMRDTVDRLKQKLGTAVIVLSTVTDGKVMLVAGVTPDTKNTVKAGELVGDVARFVGGRGGGRPDMAQAGGTDPSGIEAALARVPEFVSEKVG